MKFRYRLERININGLKEYSVQYFLCDELLIGRGASCPIHLPFRSVEIKHAKLITNPDDSISIQDLSERRGLKVNGRKVKKATLKADDRVQIGEISLETFFDGTYWGFRETRSDAIKVTSEESVNADLRRLNLARFYPSATSLSLLMMSIVVLFFFAGPARGRDMQLWSSGPISNVHHLIGTSCDACHKKQFEPVQDSSCKACHQLTEHAEALPAALHAHPKFERRCAECHMEHKGGAKPVETSARLCTECHSDLKTLAPHAVQPKVSSFERHPEFRVSTVEFLSDDQRKIIRTELGAAKDTTRLAFGHKLHLETGLRGLPKDKSALACGDCHATDPTRREMVPISFEKQCASCHPLTFDERLPDKQVPHGDATLVYNFIYAEYAKLFLVKEQQNERMAKVRRIKPGVTVIDEPDIQFTREFVEGESRNAEREIFTRTGCKVCHQITERPALVPGETGFEVLAPYMPVRWFSAAQFSHGAHESTECSICHSDALRSERTEDLLLPKVATCKGCHTGVGHPVKVDSPCISCHSFHDPLHLTESQRQSVSALLLGR